MMNARPVIVATLAGLTAGLLLPDLTSDVADLKQRVSDLEVRMTAVDGGSAADGGVGAETAPVDDPATGSAASNAVILPDLTAAGVAEVQAATEALEQRFGLTPEANQTLAERAWTGHVYEAAASGYAECVALAHEHAFLPPGIAAALARPDGALDGEKLDAFAVQGCKPFARTALQYNSYEKIRRHVFGQIKIQFKQWSRASGQPIDTEAVFEQWFENTRPSSQAIIKRAEAAINVLIEADDQ